MQPRCTGKHNVLYSDLGNHNYESNCQLFDCKYNDIICIHDKIKTKYCHGNSNIQLYMIIVYLPNLYIHTGPAKKASY